MFRRLAAVVMVVALAGLIAAPADAKKKSPELTFYMGWYGDCAGAGLLSITRPETPESPCALYFPTLGDSHAFGGSEGMPFSLDATRPVVVDVTLSHVASAAADFEVVVEGTIKGKDRVIASGSQTVVAGAFVQATPLHFELEADPALNKGKISYLTVTISWTNGVTYSQIDFSQPATVVLGGTR
jgi:hypothetical protein